MESLTDNWVPFDTIDYADGSIKEIHLDTRDFHAIRHYEYSEGLPDFYKLKNQPDRFYFKPNEVRELFSRIYTESGGAGKWRFLTLKGYGYDWSLKYIRCFRDGDLWIVCNSKKYALRKDILDAPVNTDPDVLGKY